MNIFITGAAGYIGGSVAQRLRAQGHAIRGLVRVHGANWGGHLPMPR